MDISVGVCGGHKNILDPMQLQLQVVVSYPILDPTRTAHMLNAQLWTRHSS